MGPGEIIVIVKLRGSKISNKAEVKMDIPFAKAAPVFPIPCVAHAPALQQCSPQDQHLTLKHSSLLFRDPPVYDSPTKRSHLSYLRFRSHLSRSDAPALSP